MDIKSKDGGKVIHDLLAVADKHKLDVDEFLHELIVLLKILEKTLQTFKDKL